MNLLAIDFESNGLDTSQARITELGAVLFNSETFEQMGYMEQFVYESDYLPQSEEIIGVTGITDEMLRSTGVPFSAALDSFDRIFCEFDFFLAHNKSFDESLFKAELERHRNYISGELLEKYSRIPWLCSIQDVQYAIRTKCRTLSHLALEVGVAVDPSTLHRALDDCKLLVKVVQAAKVDFKKVVERAITPWVVIRAGVPKPFGPQGDNGVGKDKAKACGFSWEQASGMPEKFALCWVKRVKENEIETEKEKLGYEVRIVQK